MEEANFHEVQFTDVYPALPPTAPASRPRIVDVATYTPIEYDEDNDIETETNMTLLDAVATMLHQTFSDASGALTKFLDCSKPPFMLIHEYMNTEPTKTVMARNGNKVIVGSFIESAEHDCFEFDNLVRYTIGRDGSYQITYVSFRDYFRRSWEHVFEGHTMWPGPGLASGNMRATPGHDPREIWTLLPRQLMKRIMNHALWEAEGNKWTIL